MQQLEKVRAANRYRWQAMYLLALLHVERWDRDTTLSLLEEAAQQAPAETEVQKLLEQVRSSTFSPGQCLRTFQEQSAWLPSVCLSADGRLALSGSNDGPLWLWETASGQCLRTFRGHTTWVSSVSLSADGSLALSGSYDKTVRLWETATGQCLRTFQGHTSGVYAVSLSADGSLALSGGHDGMRLWETATGRCLRTFQGHMSTHLVCLSADGSLALSGGHDGMRLWETASGRCLRTFQGHTSGLYAVSLSADGSLALSGSWDRTVSLWETASGQCLRTFEGYKFQQCLGAMNVSAGQSMSLSADGRWILWGGENNIRLWEMPHKRFICTLRLSQIQSYTDVLHVETQLQQAENALREADSATALDLMRRVRALPGWERSPKRLEAWARLSLFCTKVGLSSAWLARTFPDVGGPVSRIFEVNGDWGSPENSGTAVSLSADGSLALSGSWDQTMRLWETASGQCLRTFEGYSLGRSAGLSSVCLSADGRWAISGSGNQIMRLWETASGRCLRAFQGHPSTRSVCLSADGRWALSVSRIGMRLWETASGRCLRTFIGHTSWVTSVSLSADGRLTLSGSGNQTMRLWETASGRCLRTFIGHTSWVTSVSLSADGRWAISGSGNQTMRLWETASGRCLRTFTGHTSWVTSVSLSADGRWAISGSGNQTMRLWETASGRCLRTFTGHTSGVTSVSLSADGRWAISALGDMHLWELEWELEARNSVDSDEGALPTLETFLTLHTPYIGALPQDREFTMQEIQQALTHSGRPSWNEQDFQNLLLQLQYMSYGWLRPEGVRSKLEEMAASWQGPPQLPNVRERIELISRRLARKRDR